MTLTAMGRSQICIFNEERTFTIPAIFARAFFSLIQLLVVFCETTARLKDLHVMDLRL